MNVLFFSQERDSLSLSNGKPYSLSIICSALARLTYKSCFENNPEVLLAYLYSTLDLPENVKYCLENRARSISIEIMKGRMFA